MPDDRTPVKPSDNALSPGTPPPVFAEVNRRAWELLDQFFAPANYARWAAAERAKAHRPNTAARLRTIQARTLDPDLADLVDEVAALEDRTLILEAAVAHICDLIGIDPHALPDPFRPRLFASGDDEILEVPA